MASRQQVAPALIHGFIRKESAYAPDAVSTAHAKGLMQLIPRTARRIQQDRGLNEQAVDLHDPRTNIELGTWYVGVLAARYGHQAPVTKAAFNAGPAAVNSWRGAEAHVPLARWVESIPFLQAREYVTRLSATEVVYRLLLNGESLAHAVDAVLPASIDVHLDRGGVAY
jgi:soluble lytic murein transglycosylase